LKNAKQRIYLNYFQTKAPNYFLSHTKKICCKKKDIKIIMKIKNGDQIVKRFKRYCGSDLCCQSLSCPKFQGNFTNLSLLKEVIL
jgi:hypothetical protein